MKFILPFGLKNGELVHISEVAKGLACGCVCPSCNHSLVARKGEKVLHHFAHHKGKECEGGLETALHIAAKKILEKHKKIVLPEVFVDMRNKNSPDWRISREVQLNLDEVKLESSQQGIIPDVFVHVQGKSLMIEITVTHKTGDEKVLKARKQNVSILEINLEHFERDFSIEELENEIIYNTSNKKWLLNIKAEKLKEVAYLKSERKVFKGETTPNCPKGLEHYKRYIETTSDMDWFEVQKLDWNLDCSKCEFCFDIDHNKETTVFCLGKNQIKNLNKLIEVIKNS